MKIWSTEEYGLIHSKLSGHAGSYLKLWHYIKVRKHSKETVLKEVENEAASHLCACIIQAENQSAVISSLKDIKNANFLYKKVNSVVTYVIECYVLFSNGVKVQNKLLKNVIVK